jgi:hypothetical protein
MVLRFLADVADKTGLFTESGLRFPGFMVF